MVGIDPERKQRWQRVFDSSAVNHQVPSREKPDIDEGFLALHIVISKAVKQFVVNHVLAELMLRERKYIEYFTTDMKTGSKIGVSMEWLKREDVWNNITDREIQQIGQVLKANPDLFEQSGKKNFSLKDLPDA